MMKSARMVRIFLSGVLIALMGLLLYGYFSPVAQVFGKVYYRGNAVEKVVALTFDDGPSEPYTSMILDVLAEHQVKATFFLIGYNVKLYPDVARRIMAEGHVIGNHSYSHNANHGLSGGGARDAILAQDSIFELVGVYPRLYRPPHGKTTPWMLTEIKKAGMSTIKWNVTTPELRGRSAEFMANDIIKKTRPGSIILLHDGYGTLHDSVHADKSKTIEVVDLVVRNLLGKGYVFATISELLDIPPY